MISGSMHIADDKLSASSIADTRHSAYRARLNLPANGDYAGAWVPTISDTNQYLQVITSKSRFTSHVFRLLRPVLFLAFF